jgi:nucleotide-binding universal stress UspA family protein
MVAIALALPAAAAPGKQEGGNPAPVRRRIDRTAEAAMPWRRILVPVDGSAAAAAGLSEAIRLAVAQGADICLLHVREKLPALQGMEVLIESPVIENLTRFGRKVLAAARAEVERNGVRVRTVLRQSPRASVADTILAEAKSWRADVIVMGTHGRRGVTRLVLGSAAEATLRAAPVPVLLVRAPDA